MNRLLSLKFARGSRGMSMSSLMIALALFSVLGLTIGSVITSLKQVISSNEQSDDLEAARQIFRNRLDCTKTLAIMPGAPATPCVNDYPFYPIEKPPPDNPLANNIIFARVNTATKNKYQFVANCKNAVGEYMITYRASDSSGPYKDLFRVTQICR